MTEKGASSAVPKFDDFLKPTLIALIKLGGSASIEELEEELASKFAFSQEQLDTKYPKSGALVVPDRMSWARSHLKLAHYVENPKRGVWVITEAGRKVADGPPHEMKDLVRKVVRAKFSGKKLASENAISGIEQDSAAEIVEWSDKLLKRLQQLSAEAFERLCQRILRESGFTRVEITGKSGDGGIDGVGVLRVNLISFHVLFQCKRWKGSVGSQEVRNFRGAMQGRADKGLVITTANFTTEARKEATRDGAPAIDLLDGEALCALMKELNLGTQTRQVVTEEVTLDEGFFTSL